MIRSDFSRYNSLGFFNPYYIDGKDKIALYDSFDMALQNIDTREIDPVAIIEIISKGYCFADRTIIKNLNRTPWMAKPSDDLVKWTYFNLPSHGNSNPDNIEIADNLTYLLQKEITDICTNKTNIGILLSGGMDSRITAGMLKILISKGMVTHDVTAITWGHENSRDVIYAKEIARRFNWKWEHLNLDESNLLENIDICSLIGCEVSPIHLHAIPQIRNVNYIDCIIASSFGDSVGRGIFSSRHITKLSNIAKYIRNWFYLMNEAQFNKLKQHALSDLDHYRKSFQRDSCFEYLEIEQEAHYMRRLLNPCIGLINRTAPTFQTFSSPEVYGYMWSLSPQKRTDCIYAIIIDKYIKILNDIPWSKTGKRYLDKSGQPDSYLKNYHSYHDWINNKLFNQLYGILREGNLENISLLNIRSFFNAILANRKLNINKLTRIDELFVWMVSVIKMMNKYNIKFNEEKVPESFKDRINSHLAAPYIFIMENGIKLFKIIR